MKIQGLDGREYTLTLENKNRQHSELHLAARSAIKEIWPSYKTYEEVFIPGCPTKLYLDFYLPMLGVAIEVQGPQHSRFIKRFHENKFGFKDSRKRDNSKREWCELNNITLIELPHNESDEEWKNRLLNHQTK